MKDIGYRKRKRATNGMPMFYESVVVYAKEQYGLGRTVESWGSKFKRIKKKYDKFMGLLQISGSDGQDPTLYNTLEYF